MKKYSSFIIRYSFFLFPFSFIKAQAVVVPELKPNEMEIRSSRPIVMPEIKRPETTTLTVKPPIAKLPTNRPPFVGNYVLETQALPMPEGLLNEIPNPERFSLTESDARTSSWKLLGGQHFTRRAELAWERPLTYQSRLVGDILYDGTEGEAPFANQPENKSQFNEVKGEVGINRRYESHYHTPKIDGFWTQRKLFGATALTPTLLAPERNGFGLGLSYGFRSAENVPIHYDVSARYGVSRFDTILNQATGVSPTFYRSSKETAANGSIKIPINQVLFFANSQIDLAGYDTNALFSNDYMAHISQAGVQFRPSSNSTLMIGAHFTGFNVTATNGGTDERKNYIIPIAKFATQVGNIAEFYVQNDPKMVSNQLRDLFQMNPYLVDEPVVKPSIGLLNAEGGLKVKREAMALDFHVGFQKNPLQLYFEQSSNPKFAAYKEGFFEAKYGETQILSVGASFGYDVLKQLHLGISAAYRDGVLVKTAPTTNKAIPYFSPVVSNVSMTYSFPNQLGYITLNGDLGSSRYIKEDRSKEIGGYMDWDLEAGYAFLKNIRFLVQVQNMGADPLQQWQHYPQSRFVGLIGVQFLKNR